MALDDRTIGHPSPRWLLGLSLLKMAWLGGFPGGLVVRIRCFLCRDPGSVPGRGTVLLGTWHGQRYQEKKIDGGLGSQCCPREVPSGQFQAP